MSKLKAAGFVEKRTGKGSHCLFVHPSSGKQVCVTVSGHDADRLGHRILRDAAVDVVATRYPIVFEREESGVYSAYVAGLPVYTSGLEGSAFEEEGVPLDLGSRREDMLKPQTSTGWIDAQLLVPNEMSGSRVSRGFGGGGS